MKGLNEDIRSVSGAYFRKADKTDSISESGKVSYLLYIKHGEENNYYSLHKFIRMSAIPYRMVLIEVGDRENIGFVLSGDKEEQEELDSMLEWMAMTHPEWVVINCRDDTEVPNIIGFRIANNLFHAKRLTLQGEVLD